MQVDRINISYWKDKDGNEHVEGAVNYIDEQGKMKHVHFYDEADIKTSGNVDWAKVQTFLENKLKTIGGKDAVSN